MGNLLSLEEKTGNALNMADGDVDVKQKLNVTGEAVFNKNLTLKPNVLINNIDIVKVNDDLTAVTKDLANVKNTPSLSGNFGTSDISAGNITSSKTVKTSSINIDGDVISKYVKGNATDGLKLSNGKTDITYDASGKVDFGKVQIQDGDVNINGSLKVGTLASLNDKGTMNVNELTINNTKNGFSSTGDVSANKGSFSTLNVANNINPGKLLMFSNTISGGNTKSLIGELPAGITITNINVSGKLTEGLKTVFNPFQSKTLPPYNFKLTVPGFDPKPSVSLTVSTIGVPFSFNLVPVTTSVTQNSNLELEPVFSNGNIAKYVFNPLTVVISYTSTSNSMVYNGDVTSNIGIFNNLQSTVITTQSNIINSSGGTYTSPGKSGLVIQGDTNNWVLGEVQGTVSKTKRLCLTLNDKPLVCIDPTNKLIDGSKDW